MSGLVNSVLNARIRSALDRMTEEEIRALDESTSRIGLSGERVVRL